MKDYLLSGELAKVCGVSADTIRHYERRGVIPKPERTASGYRHHALETVERVKLVRKAISVGFSIDEIARILRKREAGKPPCRDLRELAAHKLEELDRRIEELRSVRSELASIVEKWDVRLASVREGELAHLLDTIND